MPLAMSGYIQAVEIEGTVYVGGQFLGQSFLDYNNLVIAYDTRSNHWHSLPRYSTEDFSMSVINNRLVLVGGNDIDIKRLFGQSRELGVWQTNYRQWMQPFPSMPTARSGASSTCYKHWLVVAGGFKGYISIDIVEVLDVNTNQWSTGPFTPTPCCKMKSVVIENTWYLMGDYNVYSASLEAIVTARPSRSSIIWQTQTPLVLQFPSPLVIGGSLLAVGGLNEHNKPTAAIMRYIPETSTWVLAGELPQVFYNCTCISVADKIYVFGGSINDQRLKGMYYHTY